MKITAALAVLITFSVSAKLCGAASAPPQDDSDYIGGSGDHAGDPRHGGPTLSPPHPGAPAEGEGALLPPADYDDEDYADYGSGDYLDYEDHGGSSSPVTPAPTTTTTTTTQPTTTTTTTQPTTTTTTQPTTATTTTTTPPPDVLAENGIYGTEEADYNAEDDDDEYYDENYYDSYDDEDYGEEGSGGAAGGDYHDPGTGTHDGHHEGTGTGDRDYDTGDRDDDLWEDDFTDHGTHGTADHAEEVEPRHDIEDPIVFEGTAGVEAESAPVDPPHDSDTHPSPDQEVWVPKVGVVPDAVAPAQDGADQGSEMDGSVQIVTHKEHERHVSVFAQPGMLAAFIGGAVVGLLCAILLVMFVVYRMRKKDEGSYPLDEPKRVPLTSSYASSGKEIYA